LYAPKPPVPGQPKASHKQAQILTKSAFIEQQRQAKRAREEKKAGILDRKEKRKAARESKAAQKSAKTKAKSKSGGKGSTQPKAKTSVTARRRSKLIESDSSASDSSSDSDCVASSSDESGDEELSFALAASAAIVSPPAALPGSAAIASSSAVARPVDQPAGPDVAIVGSSALPSRTDPIARTRASKATADVVMSPVSASTSSSRSISHSGAEVKQGSGSRKRAGSGKSDSARPGKMAKPMSKAKSFGFLVVRLEVTADQQRPFGVVKALSKCPKKFTATPLATIRGEVWHPMDSDNLFGAYAPRLAPEVVQVLFATVAYSDVELDATGLLPAIIQEWLNSDMGSQINAYHEGRTAE
jgi:hypothetical protein